MLDARLAQQLLEQQPRAGARRPPGQPTAGEVRHATDPERVAAGDEQPLLAPPQVHEQAGLAGQRRPDERAVEAPRSAAWRRWTVVRIGGAPRELYEPGDAAARAGHGRDRAARGAQQRAERRIVAAGQPQRPRRRKPDARALGAVGGDRVAGTVAARGNAGGAKQPVGARGGARRAAGLARQLPHRRKPLARRAGAGGHLLRDLLCQFPCGHL